MEEKEREREDGSARVAAREGGRRVRRRERRGGGGDGELCRPCKAARSTRGSRATPHDRPLGYTGFPNPLIRVDSHDRLEGYPPTDPPLLIRPPPLGDPPAPPLSTRYSYPCSTSRARELLARTLIRNTPD